MCLLDCTEYFPSLLISSLAATSKQITTSEPGFSLDASIASTINSKASSLEFIEGAKPPSSPTLVSNFFDFNIFFKF